MGLCDRRIRARSRVEKNRQGYEARQRRMRAGLADVEPGRDLAYEVAAARIVGREIDVVGQRFLDTDRRFKAPRFGVHAHRQHRDAAICAAAQDTECP